jgi:hypothetical protein
MILLYQRWLTERLATIENPERHLLLLHFATWHQMRRLRATAEKGPLGRSQTNHVKQEVTRAGAFLHGSPAEDAPSGSASRPTSTPGTPRVWPPAARPSHSCGGA